MRKIFLSAAVAASLFITSCQKEQVQLPDDRFAGNNGVSLKQSSNGSSTELMTAGSKTSGRNDVPGALNASKKESSTVHFKTQQIFEEPGAFWNDCTQELMNYHGNVHVVVQGVINDNKMSTVEHVNYMNLYAVGENSKEIYRGSVTQNISSNTSNKDGSYTYTGQLHLKFVSPGGKNNFVQKIFYHITINANGETTSEIDKANYGSCR
jgi:hypothetical protein